ncbi:metallophosphoesterase [Desulfosporosinus sp. OT]|uniref:metallophosphoesterase n=1 Tax=Desulfosporosinus sp. OT TaxID=913865 RepID=UPI000223B179|nr:metallophosphoesterase [Desulfosporosinus sp. OT]EGW41688.1 calcineurin-like phosphoesterase family protein [Desulfosporosinus sp. OT]
MISPLFFLVVGFIFLIYGGLNYYIGLRGWQALFGFIPVLIPKVYWTVFWLIALSYLISRFSQEFLPTVLFEELSRVGAYWLAFMFYFLLVITALDIFRLLEYFFHFIPVEIKRSLNPALGLTVFILVVAIISYGAWNARHPRINHYDLTIAKQAGALKQLHVVMVSDIHLGTIINNGYLTKLVNSVNELKPDLVLFPGDVFDENIESTNKLQTVDNFRRLNAPYGVFAVLGNHEYIGGNAEEAIKYLGEAGVQVLRDSSQEIAGSFYLIGRDDRSSERVNKVKRQTLNTLMQGVNRALPIIVMDHQPLQLNEPVDQGVDLQLSGHTHAGQLFPIRLITQRIFEDDWGYLRKGDFQLIVSSGYGTWGPPIRLGNTPEIVDITIKFSK